MDLPDAEKKVNEDVEFILVGAGLPRTGTLSTWTALEKLLPGKCHHMLRAFTGKNDGAFWTKASRGELSDEDWREFIRSERLSACVDYPMSLYWKDLATLYPNAKVLLTVRDPVRWYTSVKNTIRNIQVFMSSSLLAAPLRMLQRFTGQSMAAADFTCWGPTHLGPRYPRGLFGVIDSGEETAVRFFNDWTAQVKAEIPADRLLVFEVKQGWGPLCQFLGLPEPEEPFPNVNDTAEQLDRMRKAKVLCTILWAVGAAGLGTAAYYFKDFIPKPEIIFH